MNANTKRAEYLSALYRDFLDERYRPMRELVDEPARNEEFASTIAAERTEFTDFLNYFEFVAYLQKLEMLTREDVEAILGYYLALLHQNGSIRAYVREPSRSFENLDRLLAKMGKNKGEPWRLACSCTEHSTLTALPRRSSAWYAA